MKYDEALKAWGARRIEQHRRGSTIDPKTVTVSMNFDAGYACCGGTSPDCYCSQATSPTAEVTIWGEDRITARGFDCTIQADDFDFATVLKEIVDAGGGVIDS